MAKIQTPQYGQNLKREFKVREEIELDLLETIQPVSIVSDIVTGAAGSGYPRRCIGLVQTAAGGVGTNAQCELTAPADMGLVFQLNGLLHEQAVSGRITYRVTDGVDIATPVEVFDKSFADLRTPGLPALVTSGSTPLTAAADGIRVGQINMLDDTTLYVPMNIIMGAGDYFLVREGTANEALICTFFWTEYMLEER